MNDQENQKTRKDRHKKQRSKGFDHDQQPSGGIDRVDIAVADGVKRVRAEIDGLSKIGFYIFLSDRVKTNTAGCMEKPCK